MLFYEISDKNNDFVIKKNISCTFSHFEHTCEINFYGFSFKLNILNKLMKLNLKIYYFFKFWV